jgi:hypothetical protein
VLGSFSKKMGTRPGRAGFVFVRFVRPAARPTAKLAAAGFVLKIPAGVTTCHSGRWVRFRGFAAPDPHHGRRSGGDGAWDHPWRPNAADAPLTDEKEPRSPPRAVTLRRRARPEPDRSAPAIRSSKLPKRSLAIIDRMEMWHTMGQTQANSPRFFGRCGSTGARDPRLTGISLVGHVAALGKMMMATVAAGLCPEWSRNAHPMRRPRLVPRRAAAHGSRGKVRSIIKSRKSSRPRSGAKAASSRSASPLRPRLQHRHTTISPRARS